MKALITGGAGFIGSHLVEKLSNSFRCVVIDDLSTGKKVNIKNFKHDFFEANILSRELPSIVKRIKPDIVFHLSAQTSISKSVHEPKKDIQINFLGTLNLLESLDKVNINKIVFTSSAAIYGKNDEIPITESSPANPFSTYGISKFASELQIANWAKGKGIQYVNLRLSNVFGERQNTTAEGGVIAIFIKQMLNANELTVYGNGNQTRDFIYIGNVTSFAQLILKRNFQGTFNIGSSKETSINILIKNLENISGKKAYKVYRKRAFFEVQRNSLSSKKILRVVGWEPEISLKQGLQRTFNYFKKLHENSSRN